MRKFAQLKNKILRKEEEITGQHAVDMMTHVIGEERFFQTNIVTSTGEYLRPETNKLAYDTNKDTVRKLIVSGAAKARPHSLVFEPSAMPFNYALMSFDDNSDSDATILQDVRYEAEALIMSRHGKDESEILAKLQTALLVVAVIFGIVCLVMLKQHLAG